MNSAFPFTLKLLSGLMCLAAYLPLLGSSPETKLEKRVRLIQEGSWEQRETAAAELGDLPARMLRKLGRMHAEVAPEGSGPARAWLALARQRIALNDPEACLKTLLRELDDESDVVGEVAMKSLGILGPEVIEPLIDRLDSAEGKPAFRTVDALARHGREAAPARGALLKLLESSSDPGLRGKVIEALGAISPEHPAVVEAVSKALTEGDFGLAVYAMWCLERAGEGGVDALASALAKPKLREMASARLAMMGAVSVPAVAQFLNTTKNGAQKAYALRILGAVSSRDPGALSEEVRALGLSFLEGSTGRVREAAVFAVPGIAENSEQLVELLAARLLDPSARVRRATCEVIAGLGNDVSVMGPSLVDAWRKAIEEGETNTEPYAFAMSALGEWTPEVGEALFQLQLEHGDSAHPGISSALGAMTDVISEHVLERFPKMTSRVERALSCSVLAHLGEAGAEHLLVMTRHEHRQIRGVALRALGLTQSTAEETHRALEDAWKKPESRVDVAYALSMLGENDSGLRLKFLEDFDELEVQTQSFLIEGLAKWNSSSARFVQVLVETATDHLAGELRYVAAGALGGGVDPFGQRTEALVRVLEQDGYASREKRLAPLRVLANDVVNAALHSLSSFEDLPPKALKAVAAKLGSDDPRVRVNAGMTLESQGERGAPFADRMLEGLYHPHQFVRVQSLRNFRALGAEARPFQGELVQELHGDIGDEVYFAAEALVGLGEGAEPALPGLLSAFSSTRHVRVGWQREAELSEVQVGSWVPYRANLHFPQARARLAQLLGRIAASSEEAASLIRPLLERASNDWHPEVAEASRDTLQRLSESAPARTR